MKCVKCNTEVTDAKFCGNCGWNQYNKSHQFSTLSDLYRDWSKLHYRRVNKKTAESYKSSWRKLTALKNIDIRLLTAADFQEIVDEHIHLSRSAQEKIQHLISLLCQHAMKYGIIHINYAKFLILEGSQSSETIAFSDEEIYRIYEYAKNKGNRYWEAARITVCLIFTGYRPNEFFSFKRENINLNERFMIGGSKTKAGKNRCVPILPQIWHFIAEWLLFCKQGEYLLKGSKGAALNLRNWRIREFYPLMAELSINEPFMYNHSQYHQGYNPRVTPYSCRHTFATLAYRSGVEKELLIKMFGHTNFELTSSVYIHSDILLFKRETAKIAEFAHNNILMKEGANIEHYGY